MFIASIVFATVSIFAFIFGLFSERLVCYPIRNPNESAVLNLIDGAFDFNDLAGVDVTLKGLLINCYQDESAYNVFNLQTKFDLDQAVKDFDINDTLSTITSIIDQIGTITILNDENAATLESLSELQPEKDFESFINELNSTFMDYSLDELRGGLEDLITTLEGSDNNDLLTDTIASLQQTLVLIDVYNEKLVQPIKDLANNVVVRIYVVYLFEKLVF